jgi:hypothetical protein
MAPPAAMPPGAGCELGGEAVDAPSVNFMPLLTLTYKFRFWHPNTSNNNDVRAATPNLAHAEGLLCTFITFFIVDDARCSQMTRTT